MDKNHQSFKKKDKETNQVMIILVENRSVVM